MVTSNSPLFRDYLSYLLKEEGGKSSNVRDSAAQCAPYSGAVHTNKGVTFCTFKAFAARLGVLPVTYDRFLKLTDGDAAKFLYLYYEGAGGNQLPDWLGISMTEVAWGSGPEIAVKTLQRALNALGNNLTVDGKLGTLTRQAVYTTDRRKLFEEFWKERERWLKSLDDWKIFGDNWSRRISRFIKRFPPAGGAALLLLTGAASFLWINSG